VDYWVKDPDRLKASPVAAPSMPPQQDGKLHRLSLALRSLAMAAGLPTRIVYGSLLKATLNGVQVDGSYHC